MNCQLNVKDSGRKIFLPFGGPGGIYIEKCGHLPSVYELIFEIDFNMTKQRFKNQIVWQCKAYPRVVINRDQNIPVTELKSLK